MQDHAWVQLEPSRAARCPGAGATGSQNRARGSDDSHGRARSRPAAADTDVDTLLGRLAADASPAVIFGPDRHDPTMAEGCAPGASVLPMTSTLPAEPGAVFVA
jgi:hypothetical protein